MNLWQISVLIAKRNSLPSQSSTSVHCHRSDCLHVVRSASRINGPKLGLLPVLVVAGHAHGGDAQARGGEARARPGLHHRLPLRRGVQIWKAGIYYI